MTRGPTLQPPMVNTAAEHDMPLGMPEEREVLHIGSSPVLDAEPDVKLQPMPGQMQGVKLGER